MLVIKVTINGWQYDMLVDTGAAHTIVGQRNRSVAYQNTNATERGLEVQGKAIRATVELPGLPAVTTHVIEANLDNFSRRFPQVTSTGSWARTCCRTSHRCVINYKSHTLELIP
jgi:hypothetical protein